MSDIVNPSVPMAEEEQARLQMARTHKSSEGEGGVLGKTGFAWAWFEWARNPYYILIVIYVFAPYFARDIIGGNILASGELDGMDPELARRTAGATGQATIASLTKWAGVIAGLSAPFLGAALDRGLRRKPVLAICLASLAAMSFLLWWAKPGPDGLSIPLVMTLLIIAYVSYTYSEVAHNSMLPEAARAESLPGVSGLGLALGNLSATLLFVGLILAFALPAMLKWPFAQPLFGVDVTQFEHMRLAGPLCAVWIGVMIWPFFMNASDRHIPGTTWRSAVPEGARGVIRTVKRASEHREAFKFLIARTIYADGMSALLALGAVYVALFLDWNIIEMSVYAIWMSVFAVFGGFMGGILDRRFGPKQALIIELVVIVFILFIGLSVTQDSILFGTVPSFHVWNSPVFPDFSDMFYLFQGAFLAVFATANISSSRTMLVHVAPQHMRGEFFGLFAIAGTITVWAGPLLVELFTTWFNSQRVGMSAIALLFFLGLGMLTTVKSDKAPAP